MPVLITCGGRQWWMRRDREVLYRTRCDALYARRGVSLLRELNRRGWPRRRTLTKVKLVDRGYRVLESVYQ